ncbi:MAG: hypothetical protein U0R49_11695 [Fimbriimonadales bacterium]
MRTSAIGSAILFVTSVAFLTVACNGGSERVEPTVRENPATEVGENTFDAKKLKFLEDAEFLGTRGHLTIYWSPKDFRTAVDAVKKAFPNWDVHYPSGSSGTRESVVADPSPRLELGISMLGIQSRANFLERAFDSPPEILNAVRQRSAGTVYIVGTR